MADVDVEVITLGATYLNALGLRRWRLIVNTLGTPADRVAYGEALTEWLRGRAGAMAGDAPVRIFVMGIDQWRDEQDWPLPDTAYVDYYLHSSGRANTAGGDGELRAEAPGDQRADTYLYDPLRPVPTLGGRVMMPSIGDEMITWLRL